MSTGLDIGMPKTQPPTSTASRSNRP